MNVLYTTGIKFTFEELKLFNRTVSKRRKSSLFIYCFCSVQLLILMIQMILEEKYLNLVICVVPVLLIIFLMRIILNALYKKMWRDSGESDENWYYGFFEDFMEQTCKKSNTRVYYNQLYEIIETDTHFYPMLAKNNGFIIRKANCRPELIAFLHEKKRELEQRKPK